MQCKQEKLVNRLFRSGLAAALFAVAAVAQAQSSPPTLIDQGLGWQRFTEPLPESEALKARSAPGTQTGDPGVRELVMITSRAGVDSAPLSNALKTLLQGEFQASAGVATASTSPLEDPIVVDVALAEAVAAGTEVTDYSAYIEPDDTSSGVGTQFLGCYTGWRDDSFTVIDRTLENVGWDTNDREEQSNFQINGRLNLTGRATVKVGYQWKKSSFCIPWIARFKQAEVRGFVSMDNSNMELGWSWARTQKTRRELFKLFDLSTTVMIGPVPVRFGAQMPIGWGVAMSANYDAAASVSFPLQGIKRFDYICTFKDRCRSQLDPNDPNNTTLQFGSANGLNGGVGITGGVTVKPYVFIEAIGYLYDPHVANVGIGVEAGLPLTFYGVHGNCGVDANVQGNFMDLNAEIGLYFTYNLVGLADKLGINWDWEVSFLGLWKVFETQDILRDSGPIKVLRKNIAFVRFNEDSGTSPFTPIVVSDGTAGVGISEAFQMRMRECIPLKDAVTYRVEWGDGTPSVEVSESTNTATGHRLNLAETSKIFTTAATRQVRFTPVRDSAGRNLTMGSTSWHATTTKTVVVSDYVPPPAPSAVAVTKSGSSLTVTWSATTNTSKYKIERESNGVWGSVATVNVPTTTYTQSSVPIGTYRYRIKPCNSNGGVERCNTTGTISNTVVVGNPPPAPSSVSNSNMRCFGMSNVQWSAVSGAASYRLYASTLNNPGAAAQVYSGPGLSLEVNPPSATYYWVKACNAAGCSVFSVSTRTTVYPGCA